MTDRLPAVEPDARDLVAAVRTFVDDLGRDMLRLQMKGTDAEKGVYAIAVLEALWPGKIAPMVAAHDAAGAALNKACLDAEPVISLTTEEPA